MRIDVQFKLRSNPLYIKYLHENSYWYKILSRNPNMINEFIEEAKEYYGLRPTDKLNQAINSFEMITNIISALK